MLRIPRFIALLAVAAWSCGSGHPSSLCSGSTCVTSTSTCGDTQYNPDHCGNCTTRCGLGACNLGVCSAPPTLLYKPGSLYLRGMVSDGSSLYWVDWGTTPASIVQAPIAGGTPAVIGTTDQPSDLALLNGQLYFAFTGPYVQNSPTNGVRSMPVRGGAVTTLWATVETPESFAVDAQGFAYMGNSGNLYAGALGGSAPTLLTTRRYSPGQIALDPSNVYWVEGSSIYSIPRAGGTVSTLVSGKGVTGIAVQGGTLYYTAAVGTNADGTGVFKLPVAGGTPLAIANKEIGACLPLLDSTSVFWANCTGAVGDTIWHAPLGGGTKISLAAFAAPKAMARAGTTLCWNEGWEIYRSP